MAVLGQERGHLGAGRDGKDGQAFRTNYMGLLMQAGRPDALTPDRARAGPQLDGRRPWPWPPGGRALRHPEALIWSTVSSPTTASPTTIPRTRSRSRRGSR